MTCPKVCKIKHWTKLCKTLFYWLWNYNLGKNIFKSGRNSYEIPVFLFYTTPSPIRCWFTTVSLSWEICRKCRKKLKKMPSASILFSGLGLIDNTELACTWHIHSTNMATKSHTNLSSSSWLRQNYNLLDERFLLEETFFKTKALCVNKCLNSLVLSF